MELRFQTINVPHGINVTYSNRELNFISVENGATDKSMRLVSKKLSRLCCTNISND